MVKQMWAVREEAINVFSLNTFSCVLNILDGIEAKSDLHSDYCSMI